jgi:cell division protein ZapA
VEEEAKNRLTVDIYGQKYRMVGDASITHLRSVANYVDEKMRFIGGENGRLDTAKLAVLAAINITDEYFRLKQEYEELISILENEEKKKE